MRSAVRWLLNRRWLVLLGIALFLFVHGTYLRYENAQAEAKWDVPFEFDEPIAGGVPGSMMFSSETRLTVAVFLPAAPVSNRVHYLGAVARRHTKNGLRVVGVVPGTDGTAEWYQQSAKLPFDVVGDEHLELHMAFRVAPAHGHSAIVMFDRSGRVKFHAFEIPEEDDVRQVVEKYLLGNVAYEYRSGELAAVSRGQILPANAFKSLGGDPPDTRDRVLILLPPGCSTCQIDRYESRMLELLPRLRTGQDRIMKVALVFPNDPGAAEWTPLKNRTSGFVDEVWVTQEPGFVWDDYYTRYVGAGAQPLVVTTDSKGVVESAKALEDFIQQWKAP